LQAGLEPVVRRHASLAAWLFVFYLMQLGNSSSHLSCRRRREQEVAAERTFGHNQSSRGLLNFRHELKISYGEKIETQFVIHHSANPSQNNEWYDRDGRNNSERHHSDLPIPTPTE